MGNRGSSNRGRSSGGNVKSCQNADKQCNNAHGSYSTSNVRVAGKAFTYTGDFKLACMKGSKPMCENTCQGRDQCECILNAYRKCPGTVKKYNVQNTNSNNYRNPNNNNNNRNSNNNNNSWGRNSNNNSKNNNNRNSNNNKKKEDKPWYK